MSDKLLKILGDAPLRVLDIGARGGFLATFLPVASRAEMFGFEPDAKEAAKISSGLDSAPWLHAEVMAYALGSTAKSRTFYITRAPGCSSLLAPNHAFLKGSGWDLMRTTQMDTVALDDLCAQGQLTGQFDFIKADTQGSELEIFRSGEQNILPHVLGIETEAEFAELYQGQPRFSDVEQYLRSMGFELVALKPLHLAGNTRTLSRQRISSCEALFMRGRQWVAELDDAKRAGILPKLVVLHLLYGLCDEAFILAEPYNQKLAQAVKEYGSEAASNLRWRLELLYSALLCVLLPSRWKRFRLAAKALTIKSADGQINWRLFGDNIAGSW